MARRTNRDTRPFEPWRCTRTPAGRSLVAEAVAAVERAESRQRRRKPNDQSTFLAAVEAVVCDIAHLHLRSSPDSPSRIVITRSERHLGRGPRRYHAPALNTRLPAVLDALHAVGLIEQRIGDRSKFVRVFTDEDGEMRERRPTTIAAGPRLAETIAAYGLTFADLAVADDGELIVLKAAKADYWSPAVGIDYHDTPLTERCREELRAINARLAEADIALAEEYSGELAHTDTNERRLRRIFTQGSFDCGGRLAGGFWSWLRRDIRNTRLRINGEPIAVIDFESLHPRLCYALAKAEQPAGDLYAVPGIDPSYRSGIKKLVSARLFDQGPRRSWPKRSAGEVAAGKRTYPNMPVRKALALIEAAHPTLTQFFGTGCGHRLQRIESDILIGVLQRAMDEGLTVVPLHDAVLCPVGSAEKVGSLMKLLCHLTIGTELPMSVTYREN